MFIGGVGASGIGQMLPSLLNRLTSVSSTTTSNTSASTDTTADATAGGSDTALTGSSKAQLSDQILALLTMMQADQNGTASSTSPPPPPSSSSSTSSTMASSLSSLISAMDTDGDKTVSQSEMEKYIEGLGGTQAQADSLFSGLNQNGSGNLTSAQLTSDLQSAGASQRGHGHHHHHGASSSDVASKLTQAMDTNSDGSTSQSELESFVTSLGGTTSQADSIFSALNTQGSTGITTDQLTSAINAFEQKSASTENPILTLLDNIAGNTTNSGTA